MKITKLYSNNLLFSYSLKLSQENCILYIYIVGHDFYKSHVLHTIESINGCPLNGVPPFLCLVMYYKYIKIINLFSTF